MPPFRPRDPDTWVWSPEVPHEAIVMTETYRAANAVARIRKGSRGGAGPNLRHPDTCRSYLLRSFVVCTMYGNRMLGKTCRRNSYYVRLRAGQEPDPKAERLLDHPRSIWVREGRGAPG